MLKMVSFSPYPMFFTQISTFAQSPQGPTNRMVPNRAPRMGKGVKNPTRMVETPPNNLDPAGDQIIGHFKPFLK